MSQIIREAARVADGAYQRGREDLRNLSNLFDFFFGEATRAIGDVRAKLLDEAWFGRKTPERDHVGPTQGLADLWGGPGKSSGAAQLSFDELWGRTTEQKHESPAPDRGFDIER